MNQMPEKERKTILLTIESSKVKELNDLKKDSKNVSFLDLWQKTGTYKLPHINNFVKEEVKQGHKFLLFAHHKAIMDGLEENLKSLNVNYIRIDGNTPSNERVELSNLFRGDDDYKVALLSITVAGTGLSFTPCSRVVFAELHWTPGILCQAEDRVHRIGQKNNVDIKYLIGKETLDEYIWKSIKNKLGIVGQTLDNENNKWDLSKEEFNSKQTTLDKFFKTMEQKEEIEEVEEDAPKEKKKRKIELKETKTVKKPKESILSYLKK